MRDADVRKAILQDLAEEYCGDSSTRIVEEMGIWSGSVRIDVAVINGTLHGYELKSARDTLDRLDAQAELYNQVFDHMTLVTAEKHYYKACRKIPKWWGISIAVPQKDGSVRLRTSRKGKCNKGTVPLQVARLLWRSELLDLLIRYGLEHGLRRGTVDAMALRLCECLAPDLLREEVRGILKTRPMWLGQVMSNQGQMAVNTNSNP
jgi:hypothetical protein